jgi:WNK lysine deficient protein kinase
MSIFLDENEVKYKKSEKDNVIEISPMGHFEKFNDIIGTGSTKTVYKGIDLHNNKIIAWNVLSLTKLSDKIKKQIYREIQILRLVNHENILKMYTYWYNMEKKELIIITQLLSHTLKNFIQEYYKFIKLKHIKNWSIQILKGLKYLHSNNIIHRDLKLNNIFIHSDTSQICIGDFGSSTNINTNSCVGTPEYMPPEIYEEDYDNKVDIYAFGMCILEMLTNEIPYSECNNIMQIYKKVSNRIMPLSLNKIDSPDFKELITLLLGPKDLRPSVDELLNNNIFLN